MENVNLKTISDKDLLRMTIDRAVRAERPFKTIRFLTDVGSSTVEEGIKLSSAQRMSVLEILAESLLD